jgi:hypothetical protein
MIDKMEYHLNAWWNIRIKEKDKLKYVLDGYYFDYKDEFERIVKIIEEIQPYSICIPAKVFYDNSEHNFVEIAINNSPLFIERDFGLEKCFIDKVKLEKLYCEFYEEKGDIYDKIKLHCHIRIDDKRFAYAITMDSLYHIPYDELFRIISCSFKEYLRK